MRVGLDIALCCDWVCWALAKGAVYMGQDMEFMGNVRLLLTTAWTQVGAVNHFRHSDNRHSPAAANVNHTAHAFCFLWQQQLLVNSE